MENGIETNEALELIELEGTDVHGLMARAHAVRLEGRGRRVELCSVVNAKSGRCGEDCKFCAQSAHNETGAMTYPLIETREIVAAAERAAAEGARRYGIVTSGLALDDEPERGRVAAAVREIAAGGRIAPCASLGNVSRETLESLREAGLTRYHCNLEAAESFFGEINTTRDWSDSVVVIERAQELGLSTCCGGIFGLGESRAQRVELLDSIRKLGVDSVPINFLTPIEGTPLEDRSTLPPLECLKAVAVARLMMPDKEIRVCGGREQVLGDLQSWLLISGVSGLMVGGYLTTPGRPVAQDLEMIRQAGMEATECPPDQDPLHSRGSG